MYVAIEYPHVMFLIAGSTYSYIFLQMQTCVN